MSAAICRLIGFAGHASNSAACFANLVGTKDNGRWLIAPVDPGAKITRSYRGHTLILDTTIETADGVVLVSDFMPANVQGTHLVRLVRGISGSMRLRTELIIRFDYGSVTPWLRRCDDGSLGKLSPAPIAWFCARPYSSPERPDPCG